MKRILRLGMGILLLFAVICSTSSCSKEKEEEQPAKVQEQRKTEAVKPPDITAYLPESTEFMIKLSSIETIYDHFSVTADTLLGEPVDKDDLAEIKKHFGFNPFAINELKENGFDTGKEFGFLVSDFQWQIKDEATKENENTDDPAFNGLIFMPITDAKKVTGVVERFLKDDEGSTLKVNRQGNMTLFEDDKDKAYLLEKDNYIFIGMNPKADAKAFMESVAAGTTSLMNAKAYKDVISKADPKQEIFAYINLQKIAEKNLEAFKAMSKKSAEYESLNMSKSLEYLKEYEGIGISADIEKKDFAAKIAANIAPNSKTLNILKDVSYNRKTILGLKENPVTLISFGINLPEYYKMILDNLTEEKKNEFKANLEEIKTKFGVDMEKEVIENLGGNFNFGVYDGVSINMTNYNTMLTMSVKDEAMMNSVLAKVMSKLPPEQQSMVVKTKIGEQDVYAMSLGFVQLYVGVKDKNLIISVGKPMFEKAVSGDEGSGFVSTMQDKELANTLKGDVGIFYLNAAETFYAVKNFSALLPLLNEGEGIDRNISDAVEKFDYILGTVKLEGNTVFKDVTIKTKFTEPFFKGLANISKSFQDVENKSPNPEAGGVQ